MRRPRKWCGGRRLGDGSIYTTPERPGPVGRQLPHRPPRRPSNSSGRSHRQRRATKGTPAQPNPMQYGAGIDITPDGAFGHLRRLGRATASFMTTSTDHHTTIAASCNSDRRPQHAMRTQAPCKPSGTTDIPIHPPRDTRAGRSNRSKIGALSDEINHRCGSEISLLSTAMTRTPAVSGGAQPRPPPPGDAVGISGRWYSGGPGQPQDRHLCRAPTARGPTHGPLPQNHRPPSRHRHGRG